jgi:3'-phosphoadenosine 5'-phosphosulfate sulfotransferase (PAPS reductase)/FAD synthetase
MMVAIALDQLIKMTIEEIRKVCYDFDYCFVMFSGGRDSLAALDLSIKALNGQKVKVLFIDTGISTPGLKEYIVNICEQYNVELNIIKTEYDYFELVLKKGFPMIKYRWCKDYLKIRPLKKFVDSVKDKFKIILITGVRADESWFKADASKIYDHPKLGVKVYAPIFDWTEEEVKKYTKLYNLRENPLYHIYGKAYECWCTVFKSPADFALLAINHPEFFKKFVETEAKLRSGGSALYYNGRKIYLRDIAKDPQKYLKDYSQSYKCPMCRLII